MICNGLMNGTLYLCSRLNQLINLYMERNREIYQVTLIGGAINVILLVFKFVAGIVGHSAAMVADAVHSLSDFVTDLIVLVFVRISSQPEDKSHDYGHGKYETLAMTIIGLALLGAAVGIVYSGVVKIVAWTEGIQLEAPGSLALWAALLSVVLKEAIYHYSMAKARQLQSQAVEANAWHHRSDALSSIGTAVGIGGAILLGQRWAVRCAHAASATTMPSNSTSSWTATSPCVRLTTKLRRWSNCYVTTTVPRHISLSMSSRHKRGFNPLDCQA